MSRKNVPGTELIDAYRQEQAVLATETGQKYLELLEKHVKDVLQEELATEHIARIKAVKKYVETELTADETSKINTLQAENDEKQAEIKQIESEITVEHAEDAAKAFSSGDTASVQQIMLQIAQSKDERTSEQRDLIKSNLKLINTYKNKKEDAGIRVYRSEQDIREEKEDGTGGTSKFAFEGCQFLVESVRKTAGFSADWQVDVDTRRIFAKCTGTDWAPEFRGEVYHFAGFWIDLDGKDAISTRSKLGKYQNEWFRVAEQVHPRTPEDLLEITRRTNLRAEKGNMDGKYSMGANTVYRLVEAIESDAEDVEHQRLAANYIDPGWNELDQQKAMVQALIDAEAAGDDVNEEEEPAKAEESAEAAKSDKKTAAKSKKAA